MGFVRVGVSNDDSNIVEKVHWRNKLKINQKGTEIQNQLQSNHWLRDPAASDGLLSAPFRATFITKTDRKNHYFVDALPNAPFQNTKHNGT